MKYIITTALLIVAISGCKNKAKEAPVKNTHLDSLSSSISQLESLTKKAIKMAQISNIYDSFKNETIENLLDYQNTGDNKYRLTGLRNIDSLKKYNQILTE